MSAIHSRIAEVLGWTEADTKGLSLASLREMLPPNHKLRAEITELLTNGGHVKQQKAEQFMRDHFAFGYVGPKK